MEPAGSEAFELQPSIWKLIDHYCPPEELEEVQRILGYAIVEQARDLHCEVRTIGSIIGWDSFLPTRSGRRTLGNMEATQG